jgi:23S rRNA pseudouridine955/2504/2580 synthase
MKGLGKISQNQVASDQVSFVEIDDGAAGQRIDNFLLRVCKGVPKSHIYRILRSGEVRVNKGRVDAQYRLELGDLVRVPPIRIAEKTAPESAPVPAAHFNILFEDEAMLVIDKPAGVAVHGGSGVAFGVIEQLREARPQAKFLELVHRLDRETSGVLMLAKKRAALVGLHEQMRDNKTDKRYYACVHGEWASDWGRRRAVKEPLHKYLTPEGERRVRVQPDGQPSHTVFNLVERWPEYALLEAELKTGRAPARSRASSACSCTRTGSSSRIRSRARRCSSKRRCRRSCAVSSTSCARSAMRRVRTTSRRMPNEGGNTQRPHCAANGHNAARRTRFTLICTVYLHRLFVPMTSTGITPDSRTTVFGEGPYGPRAI